MKAGFHWLFSVPAAVLYCLAASHLHANNGSPSGFAGMVALVSSVLIPGSIAFWVVTDAQRRGRSLPYDFASFVYFAWPLIVPFYLFSTRGWRALGTLLWFALIYLLAIIIGFLPLLLSSTPNE